MQIGYLAAGSAVFALTQYVVWGAASFASAAESALVGAVFGAGAYGHVALIEKGALQLWDGALGMGIDVASSALSGAVGGYLMFSGGPRRPKSGKL